MTSPVTQHNATALRALSLHQPWADLIIAGHKTIETRIWDTDYRGPLLLCSTVTYDKKCKAITKLYQDKHSANRYHKKPLLPEEYEPRLGHALALCHLSACRPMGREDLQAACFPKNWSDAGLWAFDLTDIRPIVPIPIRGYQKLFYPDKQGITLDSLEFVQMELFDGNNTQEAA